MSAAAAVAALPALDGLVEVVGAGRLADAVRQLLGARVLLPHGDAGPAAIIETTGESSMLAAALGRVDHLGTVVLAGPTPPEPLSLDLYGDVHLRGLVVIGVPYDDA